MKNKFTSTKPGGNTLKGSELVPKEERKEAPLRWDFQGGKDVIDKGTKQWVNTPKIL